MTHFIQWSIDGGWTVYGVPIDGCWLAVDTTDEFEPYRDRFEAGNWQRLLITGVGRVRKQCSEHFR